MSNNQVTLKLNPSQYLVDNATEKEIFYISGVGGGKSFELGQWVLERASIVGTIGLLAAPTYDVMRQSTLPQVQESLAKVGVLEHEDYVVNIAPPADWGVPPFSSMSNARIITFAWGAYLVIDTLDNVNKARGAEYDYIAIDEFRDIKFSEVRVVLLGRLRGRKFKEIGKRHQILWTSTPPDDTTELNALLEEHKGVIRLVEGTSYDNKENLPENYIEVLEQMYDPLTAAREIYGSRMNSKKGKPFMYCFEDKHVSPLAVYNPGHGLRISFDFNVNPICALMSQVGMKNGKPFIHFVDEMSLQNADIDELCKQIKVKYQGEHIIVTGDYSGTAKTALMKNMNYYVRIKNVLGLRDQQFRLSPNPSHTESAALCNSILSRHPEVLFSPKCKQTIWDCRFVQWDGHSIVKKDRSKKEQQADQLDNVRYTFHAWHRDWIKR